MKQAHTNGPWKTERKNCCTHIVSESEKGIHGWQSHITTLGDHIEYDGEPCGSVCSQDKTQAEINANARLIAAAPEMLEALRGLQSEIRQAVKMDVKNHVSLMIYDAAATKAIAKATEANA